VIKRSLKTAVWKTVKFDRRGLRYTEVMLLILNKNFYTFFGLTQWRYFHKVFSLLSKRAHHIYSIVSIGGPKSCIVAINTIKYVSPHGKSKCRTNLAIPLCLGPEKFRSSICWYKKLIRLLICVLSYSSPKIPQALSGRPCSRPISVKKETISWQLIIRKHNSAMRVN